MKCLAICREIKFIIFTAALSGILIKNQNLKNAAAPPVGESQKKWVSNVFSRGLNHAWTAKTQSSGEREAEDGVRGAMTHHVSSYTSRHCSDLSSKQQND